MAGLSDAAQLKTQREIIERLDRLIVIQARTNQLLEWLGTLIAGTTDQQ